MSITRNNPKPGEFLFIGGPADGERREIAQPHETITIRIIERMKADDSVWKDHKNHPITTPTHATTYRLSKLIGNKLSFFVYLHEPLGGDDLMKALLRRYKGNDRGDA